MGLIQVLDSSSLLPTGLTATGRKLDVNCSGSITVSGTVTASDTTTRVIATGQTTLTDANQKQLKSGSQVYKRLSVGISPNAPIGDPVFIGLTGVTLTTGFPLPDIGELVMMNVDINTLYIIGTATDIVCWRGEV